MSQAACAIYSLGDDFYDVVSAAKFPQAQLRYRDNSAAACIGLADLSDTDWKKYFGHCHTLPGNLEAPLALRYHGHQFRHYNAEIGDGRGFLLAQFHGQTGQLLDLGTKGSGQTPYSRQGDGRLTLLGGIREVLAARYLEHSGVKSSQALSLIETGENLVRHDEPSPTRSAILVRLSHSHIRFGTFQRQAFFEARDNLATLCDYCQTHFYPHCTTPGELFSAICLRHADMIASWMAAGFVHGVMNTDNMNVTGESFDYGPYRFLPTLKSNLTAAYFDHYGLYSFSRQPEACYWNLTQLAQSLSLICQDEILLQALQTFAPTYRQALRNHVFKRLGITPISLDKDTEFIHETFRFLENSQASWPQFWHDWYGGAEAETFALKSPNKAFYHGAEFTDWQSRLSHYLPCAAPYNNITAPASLLYDEITALWTPIEQSDNWSAFNQKLATFTRYRKESLYVTSTR